MFDLLQADLNKADGACHTKKGKKTKAKRSGQVPSSSPVQWNLDHKTVVEGLVDLLVQPPVMAYPDLRSPLSCMLMLAWKGWILYCINQMRQVNYMW